MSPVSEVEGYCLRWNNHHGTLVDVLQTLYQEQSFVDVTLAAEGQSVQVHRLVLCACSDYFQELLTNDWDKQAIIFLKDVPFVQLKALVNYMYKGEVSIAEDQLDGLLSTAESLKIKGLTESDRRMNTTEQRTSDDLAESLRQIGPGIGLAETSCEATSPDPCEVTATLVGQGAVPSLQNTSLSMPLFTTTQSATMNSSLHQPLFSTNQISSQANTNGEAFVVEPKLETDNEVDGSAASENDDWSESDLTAPTTPHEPQQHPQQHQQHHQHQQHSQPPTLQPPQPQHIGPPQPTHLAQQQQTGGVAAVAAAQTFTSSTPFPHVPWVAESLAAAAAAAAIASSTSTIAGPSGALGLNPGPYNLQTPPPIQPAATPVRGKQRNSRRPSRAQNANQTQMVQEKPYVCNRCGRCYSRRGALIQHQRYECGIEPQFSCPMCPYKIKRKDSLNRHIRNMHHNQNSN